MVHIPPLERLHPHESRRTRITRLVVTTLLGIVAFGGLTVVIVSVALKHNPGEFAAIAGITFFALRAFLKRFDLW